MADSSSDTATPAPVSLFYSYAHEDEALRDELQRHLKILQLRGLIAPWHDRAIVPGQAWDTEIHRELQSAELVLLLLSVDFLASDYILGVELKTALQRATEGSATVVPILLRPLDLDALDGGPLPMAQLLQRQGLPRDLKAVNTWRPRDAAWVSVSKGLRATVADIQARRVAPPRAGDVATAVADAPQAAHAEGLDMPSIWLSRRQPATAPVGGSGTHQHLKRLLRQTNAAGRRPPQVGPTMSGRVADVVREAKQRSLQAQARAAAPSEPDLLLDEVLASASAGILAAQQARSSPLPEADTLRRQAMALLSTDHLPRLLWVDDQPEGNQHEADMLARLQIELVQVRSTDEALALLRHDKEGFDLVVSDWNRRGERADAGLRLQQAMQHLGLAQPLVIYHGEFEPARRQLRADAARRAGVFGEAVVPMELLGLVQAALTRQPAR